MFYPILLGVLLILQDNSVQAWPWEGSTTPAEGHFESTTRKPWPSEEPQTPAAGHFETTTSNPGSGTNSPIYTEGTPAPPVEPEGCGYVTAGTKGSIQTPRYPNRYANRLDCTWNIQTHSSSVLIFEDLDVEACAGCTCDLLDVYADGRRYGPFCGTHYQSPIYFFGTVIVTFRSDGSRGGRGFKLRYMPADEYKPVHPPTPDYPMGSSTEPWIPESTSEVTQGPTVSDEYKPVHPSTPDQAMSSSSEAWRPESTPEGTPVPPVEPEGCGYVTAGTKGSIQTPRYPNHYANKLDCTWNVQTHASSVLVFDDFDLEASAGCLSDVVDVYADGRRYGPFCGTHYQSPIYFFGTVIVTFRSDYSRGGRGFKLRYMPADEYKPVHPPTPDYPTGSSSEPWIPESTPETQPGYPSSEPSKPEITPEPATGSPESTPSCNLVIAGLEGTIETPNYPKNYSNNLHCKYTISKPMEPSVLVFVDFDVESVGNCIYDKVNVYVGGVRHGPFCGICYEKDIYFNDTVVITFDTDGVVTGRGFRADFMPARNYFPGLGSSHGNGNSASSMGTESSYESSSQPSTFY